MTMIDDSSANSIPLSKHIDSLQSNGQYTFTRHSILSNTTISAETFTRAAHRLEKKGRIVKPVRGFYFIVPLEYSKSSVPPIWYIDDLMTFLDAKYYISLLSAASIYGAGHQQPQRLQVMSEKHRRDIITCDQTIGFYTVSDIVSRSIKDRNTQTGYYKVALPEQVVVDLVGYYKHAGYFNHIATVLSELQEQLNSNQIVECAQRAGIATAQRLGYILDYVGNDSLTGPLSKWIQAHVTKYVSLRPDLKAPTLERNKKWKLDINERLELDIDT